jgi:hypothetical protein
MSRIRISPRVLGRLDAIAEHERIGTPALVDELLQEGIRAFIEAPSPAAAGVAGDLLFYRGPSLLTGTPIVGVLTGLTHRCDNPKTGPILQTWILREDLAPMAAVRRNLDDAICGDCALRGERGLGRRCYVAPWLAPTNVWRMVAARRYPEASWPDVRTAVAGHSLRLGAYGDPAAIPFEVWCVVLEQATGWVGYTHHWRRCDDRFRHILMASVDSLDELVAARAAGWRTFRVLAPGEAPLEQQECRCPASVEAGHRTTCERCQLCRGTSRPARSVAIAAHGHQGAMAAFHRHRPEGRT